MDFEGAFLDSKRALLHSLPKSGGHGPSAPVPTSLGNLVIVPFSTRVVTR